MRLVVFVPAILSGLFFAETARAAAPEPCWELIQVNAISGKQRILVSPKAFKIESIGNRWVVMSKAPDWKVISYNAVARFAYTCPITKFKGNIASGSGAFGGYLEQLPVLKVKGKETKVHGEPSLRRRIENPAPAQAQKGRPKTFNTVFLNTGDILTADYWSWANPQLPVQLQTVLNRMYRMPEGAMPLRLITTNTDKETNVELDTKSLKVVPFDAKAFVPPANLRPVKDELEVVNDNRRQRQVKNLIQNWDQWGKIIDTGNR